MSHVLAIASSLDASPSKSSVQTMYSGCESKNVELQSTASVPSFILTR